MPTSISDDFSTYADGALPTVSGGIYAKPSDWLNPIAIASHQAKGTASGENAVYWAGYTGSLVGQYAAVRIYSFDAYFGPTVFNSPVGDFYYLDIRSTDWNLFRVRSNQAFTFLTSNGWSTPTVGDLVRLDVVVDGTGSPFLTLQRNGVVLATFSDTAVGHLTSGVPGFRMTGTLSVVNRFDAGEVLTTPPGLPQLRFTDSFPWADGKLPTVSSGLYESPPSYGSPANTISVLSHLAAAPEGGEHVTRLAAATWGSASQVAQWAEVTISTFDLYVGPSVFNLGNADFYMAECTTTTEIAVTNVHSGSFTHLIAFSVSPATVSGDILRIEVQLNPSGQPVIRILRNGVLVGIYTDLGVTAPAHTAGVPGFRIWNATSRVSQFRAGDYTTAPAPGVGADEDRTRLGLEPTAYLGAVPLLGGGFSA